MRIMKTKVYNFEELSEESQQKAVNDWINVMSGNIPWESEIHDSYNKATELIYNELEELRENQSIDDYYNDCLKGIRLYKYIMNNFSYLWTSDIYYTFKADKEIIVQKYNKSKKGNEILKNSYSYKYNNKPYKKSTILKSNELENCPLTGVCFDFESMNSIIDFVNNPDNETTIDDLITNRNSIDFILENNYDDITSFESVKETILCNEYEFTEDGTMIYRRWNNDLK